MHIEFNFSVKKYGFEKNYLGYFNIKNIVIIIGKNGVGKTTFMRCLAGIEKSVNGLLKIDNEIYFNSSSKKNNKTSFEKIWLCLSRASIIAKFNGRKKYFIFHKK